MNEFSSMLNDGCLLTAGNMDKFNTMTINWGLVGNLYQKEVITVFVRPSRYTYEFIQNNEYFTLSFFYPSHKTKMSYLGTVSGRDENKVEKSGLTPISFDNDTVSFKEAYLTIVCKKVYQEKMNIDKLDQKIAKTFYSFGDGHDMVIGEIVKTVFNENA